MTRPDSPLPQPDYVNTALCGRTRLPADALLALAKRLEHDAGRRRGERSSPRPLDIDLLLWGDRVSSGAELCLPHPRLRRRRFVLEPLHEIAPERRVPPDGATVAELLERADGAPPLDVRDWRSPPTG